MGLIVNRVEEGQLRAVVPGTSQIKSVRLVTIQVIKGSGRVGNKVLDTLCHNGHGASSMPPTLCTRTESSKTVIASLFPDILFGVTISTPTRPAYAGADGSSTDTFQWCW